MKNWKKLLLDNFYPALLVGFILVFFYPVFIFRKIPIPADTIVGMYHPWRDKVWNGYKTGVPYKNFLITDSVRQQYVWRKLATDEIKKRRLPLWNPYSFSGTPLLANFQSAPLYPLNVLYFLLPFDIAWTVQVILQPILAGIFLYLYLRFMKISKMGSFLGGFTFAFSGFSIAWLEWNTVIQTAIWLPLSLLSIEKTLFYISSSGNSKLRLKDKNLLLWSVILTFSLISSFFAGHLQIFFYSFLVSFIYLIIKVYLLQRNKIQVILLFVICYLLFILITSIQWLPTLQFIGASARGFDQGSFLKDGWFMPWQNLIQFISPDFFGNPATGNYWGVWNYGEFVGYIGIIPLIFVFYALFFRRDKKTLFFAGFAILSLLFALPTPIAQLPYLLKISLISTSQPTRLIFITDFSLAILTALGLDLIIKNKNIKKNLFSLLPFTLIFIVLWLFIFIPQIFPVSNVHENLLIAKKNLILPTLLFVASAILFILNSLRRNNNLFFFLCFLFFSAFDLFRFGWKFTPFTGAEWIFPKTKLLSVLADNSDYYRIMSADGRIMPPNFSVSYRLSDVAGYDPLYLKSYGQLVAAWGRNKPDISPASFNRIVSPANYESFITDLLGVKYIMSFGSLKSEKLEYLSSEGDTYLYINKNVFPRVFLAENVLKTVTNKETIDKMYELLNNLRKTVVTTDDIHITANKLQDNEISEITYYGPNKISIYVVTDYERMLVLTDIYYPTWKAFVDGRETKIYQVNFALRGIVVPAGTHKIEFENNLL